MSFRTSGRLPQKNLVSALLTVRPQSWPDPNLLFNATLLNREIHVTQTKSWVERPWGLAELADCFGLSTGWRPLVRSLRHGAEST